ncbi:MAG TPA: S41 family peptidase [Candidatus Sulfotelmatobacter sp.]|nr:S41 family peptidase [Candidatus Sulfotelmatobacter sp.]
MRLAVLIFFGLLAFPLSATGAPTQSAPIPPPISAHANSIDSFDSSVRRDVVEKLSDALRNNYVFPDVGEKAAEKISASLSAGDYDSLSDPSAFAARLSADIAAVAHDKHLRITAMGAPPASIPGPGLGIPRSEAGVVRADRLAGGVGYIEVIGFPPLPAFKPTIDKAMLALKGSRALIIDDRRNGGGSPDAVDYLVSFLVSPSRPMEINDIVAREPKTNNFKSQSFSSQPTPVSFAKLPVYVLTSKNTFSGGEEFAYDVQTHKLGKIVGEVTGGGANPTGPVDLGHGLMASIPWGRAENPITHTNWEGRGVQPDVPVSAQDALKVALQKLGRKPASEITSASLKQVFTPRSTPLPGSEAAARQFITGIVSGTPDYAAMTPEFANFNREHLPNLRKTFLLPLGQLRSVKFEDVGMMGNDEYRALFANGAIIVEISLNPEGKVQGAMMRPAPASQ